MALDWINDIYLRIRDNMLITLVVIVLGVLLILKYVLIDSYERLDDFPPDVMEVIEQNNDDALRRALRSGGYHFGGPDWANGLNMDSPYTITKDSKVFASPDPMLVSYLDDSYLIVTTGARAYDSGWRFYILWGNDTRVVVLDRETLEVVQRFRFFGKVLTAVKNEDWLYLWVNNSCGRVHLNQ